MNLPPVTIQRYFSSTGAPLVGGKLFSYQAGTSTPQNTYTDSTGATPNTNPIILDSTGSAAMWLDPSLSYKFILQDSNGVQQWSVDNVVGILNANSVNTAALQAGAVTTAKMAANSVNSTILASDASIDANRAVTTNHIQNGQITYPKLSSTFLFLNPNRQALTSGSGTYDKTYMFLVTSANATAAAVYTNNSNNFTVTNTIAGATVLQMTGNGAPVASGTLSKISGTGDATITFSAVAAPLYLRVRAVGAGGGGSGTGGTTNGGGAGGNTTFGTITCNGGGGGATGGGGGIAGPGGTASLGSGPVGIAFTGAGGTGGGTASTMGGAGGSSPFGGAGGGGNNQGIGTGLGGIGVTNTGSGGGGAGGSAGTGAGPGGGAGGYVDAMIFTPAATYSYAIGAAGTAGAGSTVNGGAGGSGLVEVWEHFQ